MTNQPGSADRRTQDSHDADEPAHDADENMTKVELAGTIGRSIADEPPRRRAMIEWPGGA
jgi:hypothetical protein